MPMKPRRGEGKADFMARCVPEMIGTGADKRPQDQALAICYDIWKNRKKEGDMPKPLRGYAKPKEDELVSRPELLRGYAKPKELDDSFGIQDCPDPEPTEEIDDYISRCSSELLEEYGESDGMTQIDAEELCESAFFDYANIHQDTASGLTNKKKPEKKAVEEMPDPNDYDSLDQFLPDCTGAGYEEDECTTAWDDATSAGEDVEAGKPELLRGYAKPRRVK